MYCSPGGTRDTNPKSSLSGKQQQNEVIENIPACPNASNKHMGAYKITDRRKALEIRIKTTTYGV